MLLQHGATPLTRAWIDWQEKRRRHEEEDSHWSENDAVMAAVEAGHVGVLRLLLQHLSREPIKGPRQRETMDR